MLYIWLCCLLCAFFLIVRGAKADSIFDDHAQLGAESIVMAVADDGHLKLANGRKILPAFVVSPFVLYWYSPDLRDETQRNYVTSLRHFLIGKTVAFTEQTPKDRYGRERGIINIKDVNIDLAEHLVAEGKAIYDGQAFGELHERLLIAEEKAQQLTDPSSIWVKTGEAAAVNCHTKLAGFEGRFTVVVGQVNSVSRVRNDIYLNFDNNWRTDFTLFVPNVKEMDIPFYEAMADQWVEARGWISWRGGPLITIEHRETVRRLAPNSPKLNVCSANFSGN